MIVKAEGVSFTYGIGTPFVKTAVDDISVGFERGEFVGIIGHTGSGKSTFIRMLNGLEKPQSGKVFFDGEDIWENKDKIRQLRFNVGLVFQYPEYQLFEETVFEDIAYGPKNMGLDEEEIKNRVNMAMEFVGVSKHFEKSSPFELSGGQKRRVAIAGIIAMKPQVLVLDEPTAGLDPQGREDIFKRIKEYHRSSGSTVIFVSHSMEDVARAAHRVVVMNHGKIAMDDKTENIFKRVDELMEMGLDVPQVTRVFNELKRRGIVIEEGIYTVGFAAELISKRILGGGGAV